MTGSEVLQGFILFPKLSNYNLYQSGFNKTSSLHTGDLSDYFLNFIKNATS